MKEQDLQLAFYTWVSHNFYRDFVLVKAFDTKCVALIKKNQSYWQRIWVESQELVWRIVRCWPYQRKSTRREKLHIELVAVQEVSATF